MENNETILKLYENFIDDIYYMSSEKSELSTKILEQQDILDETLTEEQKKLLHNIKDLENESNELLNKNTFIFAYKLATKLIIESLGNNENNE